MASRTDTAAATHQSLVLITHLARVVQRGSETALDPGGLRPRHLIALTILRDHGATTQGALGEALRLDPSNLVGLLNELEQRGLLERRRDPGDRRRHIVEISAAGRQALVRAEQALVSVQDDVLGALDDDERATLHALLLRAAGGRLPDGSCVGAVGGDVC
ncbi:MAG: slyA [Actinomycetia bacterium]|jgi:DNA-binding MarR family transcriptional regulator|nr:slyA [Actinomycetes bacterium]